MGNCCTQKAGRNVVLLLVGLDNAGKTVTVKGLAGENTNDSVPTVGFSMITLKYYDTKVIIYDLGGGEDIRGIWPRYFVDAHGIIFVIDSSDYLRLDEAKLVLKEVLSNKKISGKPVLILANKQDSEDALDEIDLAEKLELEKLVNEQKCPTLLETSSARQSKHKKIDPGIKNGYQWLMNVILNNYDEINSRVTNDVEEEKLIFQKRKKFVKVDNFFEESSSEINGNPFRPIDEVIKANKVVRNHSASLSKVKKKIHDRPKSAVDIVKRQLERNNRRSSILSIIPQNKTAPVSLFTPKSAPTQRETVNSIGSSNSYLFTPKRFRHFQTSNSSPAPSELESIGVSPNKNSSIKSEILVKKKVKNMSLDLQKKFCKTESLSSPKRKNSSPEIFTITNENFQLSPLKNEKTMSPRTILVSPKVRNSPDSIELRKICAQNSLSEKNGKSKNVNVNRKISVNGDEVKKFRNGNESTKGELQIFPDNFSSGKSGESFPQSFSSENSGVQVYFENMPNFQKSPKNQKVRDVPEVFQGNRKDWSTSDRNASGSTTGSQKRRNISKSPEVVEVTQVFEGNSKVGGALKKNTPGSSTGSQERGKSPEGVEVTQVFEGNSKVGGVLKKNTPGSTTGSQERGNATKSPEGVEVPPIFQQNSKDWKDVLQNSPGSIIGNQTRSQMAKVPEVFHGNSKDRSIPEEKSPENTIGIQKQNNTSKYPEVMEVPQVFQGNPKDRSIPEKKPPESTIGIQKSNNTSKYPEVMEVPHSFQGNVTNWNDSPGKRQKIEMFPQILTDLNVPDKHFPESSIGIQNVDETFPKNPYFAVHNGTSKKSSQSTPNKNISPMKERSIPETLLETLILNGASSSNVPEVSVPKNIITVLPNSNVTVEKRFDLAGNKLNEVPTINQLTNLDRRKKYQDDLDLILKDLS